uniref:Uncharacterized protein n=1 Tax=Manihot esculenta TaxID=3983 RepID=A0A2C9URG8_MANES
MIPLDEWDFNNFSSYFVLYSYLRESLGKAFCFHRAKTKSAFNAYFASISTIQNKEQIEDLVTIRNKFFCLFP